jgi:probable aminopeptidase NPEPL1
VAAVDEIERERESKMDSTSVVYLSQFKPADPQNRPCRIIGKLQNLQKLSYKQVGPLLSPRANEETWSAALEALKKSDTCSLWLVNAIAAVLPYKATRHNAPSRPHALTRIVNSLKLSDAPECAFVIVCERSEVYSLGCAIARSFPRFNTSSSSKLQKKKMIEVSFILVGDNDDTSPLNGDELAALNESCEGIRLAQYIVDCPCNEMHTDGFLEQVKTVGSKLGIEPFVIRGEDLNQQGFGGLYGVGKAAVHPPVLAVLSHTPPGATKTIAWVGKGIVYDTGGLSMKTKTTMPGMKRDCGGAAAILSAFYTAVTLVRQN